MARSFAAVRQHAAWLCIIVGVMALVVGLGGATLRLAGMLSLDLYTARRIVDLLLTGLDIFTIISIIATITGAGAVGVGVLATAKWLAKKYGAQYAAAW
ncbi:MAG: circularin A/uberolysin family circular bacteriocin [Bacillota bacterium]|nr:MAG: circularin A/uberolysin family circular bacteriocin [Bacillota bacterium]